MNILDELLPESLWKSAYTCPECEYHIPALTDEEYNDKKQALRLIRKRMAENPYRNFMYSMCSEWEAYLTMLGENGKFSDLEDTPQDALTAAKRLAAIAEQMRYSCNNHKISTMQKNSVLHSIAHYCKIEADRTDLGASRFHSSVFAFPTCTANIYMSMLPDMERVESGACRDSLYVNAARQLLRCSLQTWTLPQRGDHTDLHPVSIERLRRHVWWESGNALGYRPLFYTAVIFLSVEMMETVVHTAVESFSVTSHNTNDKSFWKEGLCADGLGWAHGRQPAFQGYPCDGMRYTFFTLQYLRYTPWEKQLKKINFDAAIGYLRSSTWNQYRGHTAQPITTRMMFEYERTEKMPLKYIDITACLLMHFSDLMTKEQVEELQQLYSERYDLKMTDQPYGRYMGARYFWNNDMLAKRSDDDYMIIHMASCRCDGAEYCWTCADRFNYFASDGAYLIMKDGTEYIESRGAFKLSAMPGVTARQIENDRLVPGMNWSGFHSIHNFAGGVFYGMNGAAGFIFEKDKTQAIDGAGVASTPPNPEIFDVLAYKSYLIFDKAMVCLGTGIRNLAPELKGEIWTTINQTKWQGDIIYKAGEIGGTVKQGESVSLSFCEKEPVWVKQNGILYAVYPEYTDGEVMLSARMNMTHWNLLNASNCDIKDDFYPMFRMWINHQSAVDESRYAYVIYTGKQQPNKFVSQSMPQILSNTPQLQAAMCGDTVEAVFYDKTAVCHTPRFDITVSEQAVLMLEADEKHMLITVSDPAQNPKIEQIIISVADKQSEKSINITVNLPTGENIGKPVTKKVNGDMRIC